MRGANGARNRRETALQRSGLVDLMGADGGHPVDLAGWGVDIAYSCSQKCIGAPSGMSPVAYSGAARAKMVKCRSFYLDLQLLEDYWQGRRYHPRCPPA